jgi:hypothetical protein
LYLSFFLVFLSLFLGISFPQIIGIDWRIDYSIRSKSTGKDNIPMFYVSLKVLETNTHSNSSSISNNGSSNADNKVNNINFIASLEEMHDLLSKIRDAVKQVERILNTGGGSDHHHH